ncbi:YphA family membrane protein [Oceanobacillus kapialis]|uniref:Uncharacterized protein n=1 Tax=Oceanobacillus kapialis TaxID=481353 RepID=A0ABW5Q5C1_9BACI
MVNTALFYWVGWMLWIISTFFMKKGRRRDFFTIWILGVIITSNTTIQIGNLVIVTSIFLLIFGSVLLLIHLERHINLIICSFTIMIGYSSILFWEKVAPVWLFWPREILIPVLLCFLTMLLIGGLDKQICVLLLGATIGECLFSLSLSSYGINGDTGELPFLANLIEAIVILLFLDIIVRRKTKKVKDYHVSIDLEVAK